MLKNLLLIIFFISYVVICRAQDNIDSLKKVLQSKVQDDSNKVNLLLHIGNSYLETDPHISIQYAEQAKEISVRINFKKGIADASKNRGIGHYMLGEYMDALENWKYALLYYDSIGNRRSASLILSNMGVIYLTNGDEAKALENHLQSLKAAEEIKDTLRIAAALNNIGVVYMNKKSNYDKAMQYFLQALPLGEKIEDKSYYGSSCVNLGELYFSKGNKDTALFYYEKSLAAFKGTEDVVYTLNNMGKLYASKGEYAMAKKYHDQAYDISQKLSVKQDMAISLLGLADVYVQQKDFRKALPVYKQAESISSEIRSVNELKDAYHGLALTYSNLADFTNAFKYQTLLTDIKDTLYNAETDKKLMGLQFDFEIQKKEGEINLLTKDKALQDLDLKRQKIAKNALIAGMVLVTVIIFIIYRDYRNKIKINKVLDYQKAEIEGLLLNILPAEVAQELQKTGSATPRYYERASVLFTDFKSFSKLADALSPQEVVTELNECFIAFDEIIEKYNLEKIKTIGDSYMCAGGIPTEDEAHIFNIIRASIEIQNYAMRNNEMRQKNEMPAWEIRIGIHTGPLVAGVVGKKKYAYDIWGGTVNIASRMESNGEPGKVNISAATYELVKDKFACTYRGKIYAKNIGEIDMYFVDHELV